MSGKGALIIRPAAVIGYYSPPASLETQSSQRKSIISFLLIEDSRYAEEGRKEKTAGPILSGCL